MVWVERDLKYHLYHQLCRIIYIYIYNISYIIFLYIYIYNIISSNIFHPLNQVAHGPTQPGLEYFFGKSKGDQQDDTHTGTWLKFSSLEK